MRHGFGSRMDAVVGESRLSRCLGVLNTADIEKVAGVSGVHSVVRDPRKRKPRLTAAQLSDLGRVVASQLSGEKEVTSWTKSSTTSRAADS